MSSSLNIGSLLGSLFIKVRYYVGDPRGVPNLENCRYECSMVPSSRASEASIPMSAHGFILKSS